MRFSDVFILQYVREVGGTGTKVLGFPLNASVRKDMRDLYAEFQKKAMDLYNLACDVILEKGLFIRPPRIPYPKHAEYVDDQAYPRGYLGERRPLNALEISHLFTNGMSNSLGKAIMLAFSQVTKSSRLKKHFLRGHEIADKHLEIFNSILKEENLAQVKNWESEVTASTEAPFSDKLMTVQTSMFILQSFINYGGAISVSARTDLPVQYTRLSAEVAKYSREGVKLMIKNRWLERSPEAADREDLVKL